MDKQSYHIFRLNFMNFKFFFRHFRFDEKYSKPKGSFLNFVYQVVP
jgi:hypothetical protein